MIRSETSSSTTALRFRPIDLVGIPIGVIAQLVIVPLVYVPLRGIWPDTFSKSELEERARELADKANGWTVVLLVVIVVIGAPLVEELVYRGLLQRSMSGALGVVPGLVIISIWFALMHPTPIEWPGLARRRCRVRRRPRPHRSHRAGHPDPRRVQRNGTDPRPAVTDAGPDQLTD